MEFYAYKRVSTDSQDTDRQTDSFKEWQIKNGILIPSENIFEDKKTGKNFDREQYKKMKSLLKKGDYLIIKEVDRLGRDWDLIRNEWQEMKDNGINIIIIDTPILSDPLPGSKDIIEGLDLRFLKEQIFTLLCYTAQKEREKISQRTKEKLKIVSMYGSKSGNPIGRPRSKKNSDEKFLLILEKLANGEMGQKIASLKYDFPISTLKWKLKNLYQKYNTTDYKIIYNNFKKELEQQESEVEE